MRSTREQMAYEDEARIRHRHTAQEKLEAVQRELRYRRNGYGRRVAAGQMTQALADRQISIFESIEADYSNECARGRLL